MRELGYIIIIIGGINIIKNYRNGIKVLISLELIFIGIGILILNLSIIYDDIEYMIIFFIILLISAIETTIGLIILLSTTTRSNINILSK